MKRDFDKRALVAILIGAMLMVPIAFAQQDEGKPPHLRTATGPGASMSARGSSDADKLSTPLKVLNRRERNFRISNSQRFLESRAKTKTRRSKWR